MTRAHNQTGKCIRIFMTIGLASLLASCQPVQNKMEPIIAYTPPSTQISDLPTAFSPLNREERNEEWSKEILIADAFSKELDLYRAITCYKRALVLIPGDQIERRLQIEYDLILCYYLGQKYQEAINIFEASDLTEVNPLFPAFNNLLIILHDSYLQTKQDDKASRVLEMIEKCSPETAVDLKLYSAFKAGELNQIRELGCGHRNQADIENSLATYDQFAKSPSKARRLNTILPGAGYYYIGQKRSAVTAFIINTLFTAAAYQFFQHGYWGAGLITSSLEVGWYFGGINGAGLEAEEFNTRLYEGVGKKIMSEQKIFPVLMLETSF